MGDFQITSISSGFTASGRGDRAGPEEQLDESLVRSTRNTSAILGARFERNSGMARSIGQFGNAPIELEVNGGRWPPGHQHIAGDGDQTRWPAGVEGGDE